MNLSPSRLLPDSPDERLLAWSWFIKTVGSGLYLPSSALFLTRVAGLSTDAVAWGLAFAAGTALLLAVPLGTLSDRWGPRRIYSILLVTQFFTMGLLAWVRDVPSFLVVIVLFTLAEQGSTAARGALIARVGVGAERVRLRAYLRVVTNVGVSVGAGAASLAIATDSERSYTLLLLATALTFLGAALPLRSLSTLPVVVAASVDVTSSRWQVLADRRYVALTSVCAVIGLLGPILAFGVPLWVVEHTDAAPVMVSAVVVINTLMVIFLQIPASRGAENDPHAARLLRRSGIVLALACVALATTSELGPGGAAMMLVAFAVLFTAGELWMSAGSFGLSFSLAPEDAHGQYQGFFSLARGISNMVGPVLLAEVCLKDDPRGWVALGLVFMISGLVSVRLAR